MTGGEGMLVGLAVTTIALLIVSIVSASLGPSRPSLPPPPPVPSTLTPAEAQALGQATATGVPVDFWQQHPVTAQPVMCRAIPMGGGHGQIVMLSPNQIYPQGSVIKTI